VAVLDRSALDNVPTSGSIYGIGQLVLGVTLSAPDIGGSANAMSRYMSLRGGSVSSNNNTVMVDGMVINGLQSDGGVQTYINDADFQEMTYQTAGIGAERSGGGVTLNMVPREAQPAERTGTASISRATQSSTSERLQTSPPLDSSASPRSTDRSHLRLHRDGRRADQEGQAVVFPAAAQRAGEHRAEHLPDDGSRG
jgi:hypothetical protein